MIPHKCTQGSDEWFALKRGIPSASSFSRIIQPKKTELSASAMGYVCELIADKYDLHYFERDDYVSAAMKQGMVLEPEAIRTYEFHRNVKLDRIGFVTRDDGKVGCSPDAIVGEDGVIEIKAPEPKRHVEWFLKNELPDEHKCQVHGELLITGANWADFMSYCPGFPPLIVRVEPDDFTKRLAEVLEEFLTMYELIERQLGWTLPKDENAELTESEHPF